MTPRAHARLRAELDELVAQRDVKISDDTIDAYEHHLAVSVATKARIRQIRELLKNAVVGETPPDDGIAEPGMVLTVRFDDTGETETFLLVVGGDAEDGALEICSTLSPLGTAIAGAQPGDRRTYLVPSGATVAVTLLRAVPYGSPALT